MLRSWLGMDKGPEDDQSADIKAVSHGQTSPPAKKVFPVGLKLLSEKGLELSAVVE